MVYKQKRNRKKQLYPELEKKNIININGGESIVCPQCNEKTLRSKVKPDRGCRNDMQSLTVCCALCGWNGPLKNYEAHLGEKHPNPMCEFCHATYPSVIDLNEHVSYQCPEVLVHCPLEVFGCEDNIRRTDLSKHYSTGRHQRILINVVPSREFQSSNSIVRRNELEESLDVLSTVIQQANEDQGHLRNECRENERNLEALLQDLSVSRKSVEEEFVFLQKLVNDQQISQCDIVSIQQKLHDMKSPSSDGTLIWRITDVKQKIEDAKSNVQPSILSPVFYSSPTGYKICLCLHPNGNDSAQHTHMSLYFVLMRGEYDSILTFPFCFKMIFCLIDQTGKQQHIFDVLEPDLSSSSYQRPQSEKNTPIGFIKFVPLRILQQGNNAYVRNDTMFIKAMIDFTNHPKEILSYVLNISPGMTAVAQHAMIEEERRVHQQRSVSK
ncbi:unnamed protein product [Adineta ricciae]|uniref:MATH domain-containing protein n=1 Tax=Adineta ricciae TaxID=249248 RepID=A0A814IVW0_ADIRI|nr:unnamed protein product [Adineta ricciae]